MPKRSSEWVGYQAVEHLGLRSAGWEVGRHGVALAAIQGLHQSLLEKDRRLADLERENRELRGHVRTIQEQLEIWIQDSRRNE